MIQLIRPPKPEKLAQEEQSLTQEYKEDHNKVVWNKSYIKEALLKMSNNKCCYCECKIGMGEREMHVDHFKPKSVYPDLVVQWDNLLPSCPHCNKQKSSHDTVKEPIINPAKDDPKKYFYLKNYRYFCKDNRKESISRRTLGVLSLNDTTENVTKRFEIGEQLLKKIEEIANIAVENKGLLETKTIIKNRIKNGCRDIMRQGTPDTVYSAFMSTLIYNDKNFNILCAILKEKNLWDEELETLYQVITDGAFDEVAGHPAMPFS